MKVGVTENEGCFGIDITAETMDEAATLTRLGANATKDIRHFSTWVSGTGNGFRTSIVFGKSQRGLGQVPNYTRKV